MQLHFPGGPHAPELSGDLLGWADAWACCWEVTGALGPRKAGGMHGSQFALEIRKETVFSGGDVGLRAKLISINI